MASNSETLARSQGRVRVGLPAGPTRPPLCNRGAGSGSASVRVPPAMAEAVGLAESILGARVAEVRALRPQPPHLAKAAHWYAGRGWAVLPVAPRGKAPACRHGHQDATTDPAQLSRWWELSPEANVGIATGPASGLWVLDVDGPEGCATMAGLERRHGALPATVTAKTGGGGLHLLWRLPEGLEVASRARVAACVDVRGAGGYIVAPPSVHASGTRYEWYPGRGPHETALAEAPAWLLAVAQGEARGATEREGSRTDWAALVASHVQEGARNDTMARLAGYLLRGGLSWEVAEDLLDAWSERHCTPPLPRREIRATVRSISRRERRRRAEP